MASSPVHWRRTGKDENLTRNISGHSVEFASAWARYRVVFGPPVGGDRLQVGEMRLLGERAPVPPTLGIRASGNSILVNWPDTPGFQLETRSTANNGNWTAVGITPVLSNGINTVTVSNQGIGFFRLRK